MIFLVSSGKMIQKQSLLKFIRTIPNRVFGIADIYGIKLLTRLHVGLSHLREHTFRHNFQDTINLLCSCSLETESTSHFFLRCQNFITPWTNLSRILNLDEISLSKLPLYVDTKFGNKLNKNIIKQKLLAPINFALSTKRFGGKLIWRFFSSTCLLAISFLCVYFTLYASKFHASLHGHSKVMKSCFSLYCTSVYLSVSCMVGDIVQWRIACTV